MAAIEPSGHGCLIHLKVVPGSSRDAISGLLGDRLKIRVAATPEAGKANASVCALLARALGIKPRDVEIVAGLTSPEKTARIKGISADAAAKLLA